MFKRAVLAIIGAIMLCILCACGEVSYAGEWYLVDEMYRDNVTPLNLTSDGLFTYGYDGGNYDIADDQIILRLGSSSAVLDVDELYGNTSLVGPDIIWVKGKDNAVACFEKKVNKITTDCVGTYIIEYDKKNTDYIIKRSLTLNKDGTFYNEFACEGKFDKSCDYWQSGTWVINNAATKIEFEITDFSGTYRNEKMTDGDSMHGLSDSMIVHYNDGWAEGESKDIVLGTVAAFDDGNMRYYSWTKE